MYHRVKTGLSIDYLYNHNIGIKGELLLEYKQTNGIIFCVKDTLWVLSRDKSLVHVSIDISLITKDILDHVISLES